MDAVEFDDVVGAEVLGPVELFDALAGDLHDVGGPLAAADGILDFGAVGEHRLCPRVVQAALVEGVKITVDQVGDLGAVRQRTQQRLVCTRVS
jgi:hypothetical protein